MPKGYQKLIRDMNQCCKEICTWSDALDDFSIQTLLALKKKIVAYLPTKDETKFQREKALYLLERQLSIMERFTKQIPVKFTYPTNVYVSDTDYRKYLNNEFKVGDKLLYSNVSNGEKCQAIVVGVSWKLFLEKM